MIIFVGVVGAGKSLQGQMLASNSKYKWLSTGEIIRTEMSEDRQKELLTGKLFDDQEMFELVGRKLKSMPKDVEVVLDGFPRNMAQVEWLLKQIKESDLKLNGVVNFVVSKDVAKSRLLNRARSDDNEAAINERFKIYETKVVPLIEYFKDHGIKVYEIDASKTPEEVHQALLDCLNK